MANQITFFATITPASAPVEVTLNAGATFTALAFATVGATQQATLSGVAPATYAIGAVGLRAVGYPGTVQYNQAPVLVSAAQTVTLISSTAS